MVAMEVFVSFFIVPYTCVAVRVNAPHCTLVDHLFAFWVFARTVAVFVAVVGGRFLVVVPFSIKPSILRGR